MAKKFLIPKSGIVVKFPDGKTKLPPAGAEVEMNTWWHRRLRDGDVTERKEEEAAPAPAAKAEAAPTAATAKPAATARIEK